jgi:hypothetical protein
MITIKGNTPDEKIAHVERILNKMSRRLHRTIIGVIPPVPVMFSTPTPNADGSIFTFLAPASGTITDICLVIKEFADKDPVPFVAQVNGPSGGAHINFLTRKNLTIQAANLQVSAGDLLSFSTSAPDKVKGVWLSFLYQFGMNKLDKTSFLIDEFEKLIDQESSEVSADGK